MGDRGVGLIPVLAGISDEVLDVDEDSLSDAVVLEATRVDLHAAVRFTVGNLGSLSEVMGQEAAERYLDQHSLTRVAKLRAARRLGY